MNVVLKLFAGGGLHAQQAIERALLCTSICEDSFGTRILVQLKKVLAYSSNRY